MQGTQCVTHLFLDALVIPNANTCLEEGGGDFASRLSHLVHPPHLHCHVSKDGAILRLHDGAAGGFGAKRKGNGGTHSGRKGEESGAEVRGTEDRVRGKIRGQGWGREGGSKWEEKWDGGRGGDTTAQNQKHRRQERVQKMYIGGRRTSGEGTGRIRW